VTDEQASLDARLNHISECERNTCVQQTAACCVVLDAEIILLAVCSHAVSIKPRSPPATDVVDQNWMRMHERSSSIGCSVTRMAVTWRQVRAGAPDIRSSRFVRSVIFRDDVGGLSRVWRLSVSPAAQHIQYNTMQYRQRWW